ncbi:Aste57867_10784 [Aphanomyces stellatus]|uniref:Aste57867_10784 protein n=1 Tax=Aphanomyces stellatus TaxID=120398 RepID=A0A485KR91_9STRA|nr:hypothetical protein As57867_010744 [Aphanomyces stellatus]VFT87654.1 Aste57867_10784 [Aphanomyces stellatus]
MATTAAPSTTKPVNGALTVVPVGVALTAGEWKVGVFGCFTDVWPNCCMAFFCPCVSLAQTHHRAGIYSYTTALLVFALLYLLMTASGGAAAILVPVNALVGFDTSPYGNTIMVFFCVADVFAIVFLVLLISARGRIRALMKIPGSCCEDCCCVFWCQCCVIAQMATQVEAYTPGQCNFGPKDTLPGFAV